MKRLNIMIAEDEPIQVMGIKTSLEKINHRVIGTANDGEEAISLALKIKPDLIIMDIKMPKIDGIKAAKKINAHGPIPIILLTAYSDETFIQEAKDAGVFGYIIKPIEEHELAPVIELALYHFERIGQLEKDVKDLREELKNRKVIERAKGILMDRRKISEQEAMTLLQKESRRQNKKLIMIAESILTAESLIPKL